MVVSSSSHGVDIIQFCTWGERWGGSDYATRAASGPDGSNGETQPIYDLQIEFSSVSTNEEHATASEPETHRRHNSRTQNRRSERCSGAKRAEPYRGIPLPKAQSGTTAVEYDMGLAWGTPASSSPEGCAGAPNRAKRSRVWKPTQRRHATPDSVAIPVSNGTRPGTPSHSSGSIPTTFPPDGIAWPDDRLASSPEEDGFSHFFHDFYPLSPHDVSTSTIEQTGHQVTVGTSYATPSGSSPPFPAYGYNMPDGMIHWALTYPVVTATCQTMPTAMPPYTVAPGVNQPF